MGRDIVRGFSVKKLQNSPNIRVLWNIIVSSSTGFPNGLKCCIFIINHFHKVQDPVNQNKFLCLNLLEREREYST